MLPFFIFALMAAANTAVAVSAYQSALALNKAVRASNFCVYPDEFVVKNFQIWTPDAGNNRSTIVDFDYSDETTKLDTKCHLNGTSVNVAAAGLAARYACDLDWIQFVWQNGTLTLIETVCPYEEYHPNEAAGSITPQLACYPSTENSPNGAGNACVSKPRVLSAIFTSLEPTPK